MNCEQLKHVYQNGAVIIDVRDPNDFLMGHIPNSINIEHVKLIKEHSKYLIHNTTYYIICDTGTVSRNVVQLLQKYSYKLIDIIDGFESWTGPIEKLS
jgi:rhodanese-related sulfurtransferase